MLTVTGVQTQDVAVVAQGAGVVGRAAQGLSPVGRQPGDVLGMQTGSVERVAGDRVVEAAAMPGLGKRDDRVPSAYRVEDGRLHGPILDQTADTRQAREPSSPSPSGFGTARHGPCPLDPAWASDVR